jgi:hypothetical protein
VWAGRGPPGLLGRVHVQVGQVARAQDHEVAVGAEVGLQVGHRDAVPADAQGQFGLLAGGRVPIEDDGVAVHFRPQRRRGQRCGHVLAGHREVGAEDPVLAVDGGHEVGEEPPRPGRQVQGRPPDAVGPEVRVDVLEAGQVAAHGDEVQVLLVALLETGHGGAVGAEQPQGDGRGRSGRGGPGELQRVAVLGDGQAR